MPAKPKILILPGLYGSGPTHWQSQWEQQFPDFERVVQRDLETPDRAEWVATLDQAIRAHGDNVIVVAHSLGCITVAHWAEHSGRSIAGALLVAPSDTERPGFPAGTTGFAPIPQYYFPFPSIVVSSNNDRYISAERTAELAEAWGSRFVSIGDAGHITADDGYGPWPEGLAYLRELEG